MTHHTFFLRLCNVYGNQWQCTKALKYNLNTYSFNWHLWLLLQVKTNIDKSITYVEAYNKFIKQNENVLVWQI